MDAIKILSMVEDLRVLHEGGILEDSDIRVTQAKIAEAFGYKDRAEWMDLVRERRETE